MIIVVYCKYAKPFCCSLNSSLYNLYTYAWAFIKLCPVVCGFSSLASKPTDTEYGSLIVIQYLTYNNSIMSQYNCDIELITKQTDR